MPKEKGGGDFFGKCNTLGRWQRMGAHDAHRVRTAHIIDCTLNMLSTVH